MDLVVRPSTVVRVLWLAIAALTLAHVAAQLWGHLIPPGRGGNLLLRVFDLDAEASLPTLLAVLEWLLAAVLLAVIGAAERTRGDPHRPWFGLAAVFAYLTVDEVTLLHETLSGRLRQALDRDGLLFYPWVVAYLVALGVLAALYARFFTRLPARTRALFLLSAVVFVGVGVGTEILEGPHVDAHGRDALYRVVYVTIEESAENAGVLLFIYALLDYLHTRFSNLRLRIIR